MGVGAGGEAINMGEGLVLNAYYPPSAHLKGVMVDALGRRFVNEDAYIGRTSDAILTRAQGRAYLVVDDVLCTAGPRPCTSSPRSRRASRRSRRRSRCRRACWCRRSSTTTAAPSAARIPCSTRRAKWLRPLQTPPYAALDCSTQRSIFGVFTLGRPRRRDHGRGAAAPEGEVVPGLYAAGRCTRRADPRGAQLRERALDRRRELLRAPRRPARRAGVRPGSDVSALSDPLLADPDRLARAAQPARDVADGDRLRNAARGCRRRARSRTSRRARRAAWG